MIDKEDNTWHMEECRHNEQYYQCLECGRVHRANTEKVIDLGDDTYYETLCPNCRGVTKHLWVGADEDDIYMYYDVTLDETYF